MLIVPLWLQVQMSLAINISYGKFLPVVLPESTGWDGEKQLLLIIYREGKE